MNTMKTFLSNVLDESFKTMHLMCLKPDDSAYSCELKSSILEEFLHACLDRTQIVVESRHSDPSPSFLRDCIGHSNKKTVIVTNEEGDVAPFRMTYVCRFSRKTTAPNVRDPEGLNILMTVGIAIEKSFIQPLIAQFIIDFQFNLQQTNDGTWIIGQYDGALRSAEFIRDIPLYNTRMLTRAITDFIGEVLTDASLRTKLVNYHNEKFGNS